MEMVLTLSLSAALGYLLYRKHIPAGMLIGAVLASAILSVGFQVSSVPDSMKNLAQIIAGTYIGCSARKEDIRQLKSFYRPVLLITASLLLVNLCIGFLLHLVGYSDLLTCLVCAVPGGISDVTLIAVDFGADSSKVLVIHFCRLVVGIMLFPSIVDRFTAKVDRGEEREETAGPSEERDKFRESWHLLTALALAALSAWVGNRLNIPAATILFSLLSTFLLNLSGFSVRFPSWLRQVAQILSGAYIGGLLNPELFSNLKLVFAAILITIVVLLANAALFGKLLEKYFAIPMREGMLMLTPAGASDMALISADIGIHSPRLILVQIYRLLIATAIFPQICLLVSRLLTGIG